MVSWKMVACFIMMKHPMFMWGKFIWEGYSNFISIIWSNMLFIVLLVIFCYVILWFLCFARMWLWTNWCCPYFSLSWGCSCLRTICGCHFYSSFGCWCCYHFSSRESLIHVHGVRKLVLDINDGFWNEVFESKIPK